MAEIGDIFRSVWDFLRNPAAFFERQSILPDTLGALIVLDTYSFLAAVGAVTSGAIPFAWTWAFLWKFLVAYFMFFVLMFLYVYAEAGYAMAVGWLMGVRPGGHALFTSLGFCRLPLVVSALLYIFLPERLCLGFFCGPEMFGGGTYVELLLGRIEVFELVALVLEAAALFYTARFGKANSVLVAVSGWLIFTGIFYRLAGMIF